MSADTAGEHRRKASDKGPVVVALITVSDTRTDETDVNGVYLRDQLSAAGHTLHSSRIVRDEPEQIRTVLDELTANDNVQVLLFNGGTGLSGATERSTSSAAVSTRHCLVSARSSAR